MKILEKISKLKKHPGNPRTIKKRAYYKLLDSIESFPEMREVRHLVVNKSMQVIGGNQRLSIYRELKIKETHIEIVNWSEKKQKEFIIRDNINSGEWDMDIIANEWDLEELESYNFELPNHVYDNNLDFNPSRTEGKCFCCGK